MDISFSQAINAYREAAGGLKTPTPDAASKADSGDSFSGLVRNAVEEAIDVGKAGEEKTIAAIAGKADLNEVITAVANAEVTLQTAVTLRDRVIQAYQEVLRMPI